jgi:hypothetical protein
MSTLNQILLDSSATLDLSASLPTGDELTLRENYANQAVLDASGTGQFSEFKKEFQTLVTSTIVTLPSGFRELQVNPQAVDSSGGWHEFPEIDIEDKYDKAGQSYVYITGNPQSGYLATFNGAISGMSLSVIYQAYPAGMQSLSAVCELPDPTYVTRKIESYVLYSRGDDKFPIAEQRANTVLLNMVGREMKSPGGQGRSTPTRINNPLQ